MLRKRCTVEIVVDLPVKGPLSDVKRFIKTSQNNSVDIVSYKITKTEQLEEELLPHEQASGQRRAIKVVLEDAVKKAGLNKYIYVYMWKWGNGGFRFITRKYKCDNCKPATSNPRCRFCKKLHDRFSYARSYKFDGSTILLDSWSYSSKQSTVVGSIADPNMTDFIKHLKSLI